MLIPPYDLGKYQVLEDCYKLSIDELVATAQRKLKLSLLKANIEALGVDITLTTSKTNYTGVRFWFLCPCCQKRVGVLYRHPIQENIGCRNCLGMYYRKQRYKGMVETLYEE